MMHGPEKSDPGVVAMKPANKTEQSVAEPVERRAGTKGNPDQQSTCRTQSRISVSQALERIRKVQNACRQTPEVGAVCGKAARTVLCGGRSAMSVPTASEIYLLRCVSLLLARRVQFLLRTLRQLLGRSGSGPRGKAPLPRSKVTLSRHQIEKCARIELRGHPMSRCTVFRCWPTGQAITGPIDKIGHKWGIG